MRDSLQPVVVGLAVGAGAAWLAAAILAVLVPTRRAAAVDAAVVLRRS